VLTPGKDHFVRLAGFYGPLAIGLWRLISLAEATRRLIQRLAGSGYRRSYQYLFMPQLDFVAFFSTVLWLALFVAAVIILALVYVLPNLVSLLKIRKNVEQLNN
jgi:hypothetical protein